MTKPNPNLPAVQALLTNTDVELYDDPEAAAVAIANEILSAKDAAAVLAPRAAIPAGDVLNTPLEVRGVRFNRSAMEDGPAVYALIEAVNLETGELCAVTCGSRNVMTQLYRLLQLDALPTRVRIVRASRQTASGFWPLWLTAA